MKYYLHYVLGCSPEVFECDTESQLKEFLDNWMKTHGTLDDNGDNWIEVDKIYCGKKVNLSLDINVRTEE